MLGFKLAIDGPSGAGKSTVSQLLTQKLNWFYLNTGLLFRAITFTLLQNKIDYKNVQEREKLNSFLSRIDIQVDKNIIYVDNQDITSFLNTQTIENKISYIAGISSVREKILILQQNLIQKYSYIIMDGRDIGTVIMPQADLKIFLTASITERANRKQKNTFASFISLSKMIEYINQRDQKDMKRTNSPLIKASDAILIDTTNLSINKVTDIILKLIRKKQENSHAF
ncbi:(d)CMP kinase [Candidatus Phytoplasma phoenicium]|uniref:Cytidylate kinase n=1 Tax=Candidatus Phytoplasma phoenicium TaxID=198422 RepID=A0A2S8NV41_9MOLU|nr:(d)CMP kinase [Candidatus Phytoplasma phoenicium]